MLKLSKCLVLKKHVSFSKAIHKLYICNDLVKNPSLLSKENMIKYFALIIISLFPKQFLAQQNIVTYLGNNGKETLYDVLQISNGHFLACGYADNLDWILPNIPRSELTFQGNINNSLGSNRYGIIIEFTADLQNIIRVVHFPKGVVEDIRMMKTNSLPYESTGDIFISCNTSDTDSNDGGYIIAKLNGNFISNLPNSLIWFTKVWAKSITKEAQPWDVSSKGEVYYVSGEAYGYDWSALYCLNQQGQRKVVKNWRTHWLKNGNEWKGTPAANNPFGSIDSVKYSGIVLKIWGRCELRSWTNEEHNATLADGNGGTKKGTWPADFLFDGPCDPSNPSASGPGYNGYSAEACCPVFGLTSLVVDRRNNDLYFGMSFKSYAVQYESPDFEPAVIAMDSTGDLRWWSRLYHEISPSGEINISLPDQYVDALAIDYTNNTLVVGARCHGNNTQNFWSGNQVASNPSAFGFQNRFTGNSGNNHVSWLGKLGLLNGALKHSTFMAEYAEGTSNFGVPHPDDLLDGWPDPNSGWPNVNTTRMAKNAIKVSSNGAVCLLAVGRRTITTANAYQKMVKPFYGGLSAWNSFVRVYNTNLEKPIYSSLIVGAWDTLTQNGGDNTELFGIYKTAKGVVCVGRQKANLSGESLGNLIPLTNIPPWGVSTPENETAIIAYLQDSLLFNQTDSIANPISIVEIISDEILIDVFPNPSNELVYIKSNRPMGNTQIQMLDMLGNTVFNGAIFNDELNISAFSSGTYIILIQTQQQVIAKRLIIIGR